MSSNAQMPGLDCPQCSHRIPMTIPLLLSGRPFFCQGCGLKIEVDSQKSSYVLDRLQNLQNKLDQADKMAKEALGK